MKKFSHFIFLFAFAAILLLISTPAEGQPPDTIYANIEMQGNGCVNEVIAVFYSGTTYENATYTWDFEDAVVLSGSGAGPYEVKWETSGLKSVSVVVHWENLTGEASRQINVRPRAAKFQMTGGGSYAPGGEGVEVGLSGSQPQVLYFLRRGAYYTGVMVTGTGSPVSFGLQTEPGSYNAVADTFPCRVEMEGVAIITLIPFPDPKICMVTYDTLSQKNEIIWNKTDNAVISLVNIYKENSQNEVYEKIAEVPWSSPGIYLDENSSPLVRSYKYRISFTDTSGNQSEKSPYHKTLHLNINAGIYGFNLMWNHYEGFEFNSYNIYRKIGEGPFEKIAEIASNIDSYTDFYTTSGLVTYYIEVIRPEACQPELKSGIDAIRSNTATAAPLGIEDQKTGDWLIYPNPVKGKLFVINSSLYTGLVRMEIFQPNGQVITSRDLTSQKSEIDLSSLTTGVYMLRLTSENSTVVRKIIKE